VVIAYAPLDRWVAAREWSEPPFALAMQLVLVALALAFERRRALE
jgi:hypothetical protein